MSRTNTQGQSVVVNALETPLEAIEEQKGAIDVLIIGSGTAGVTTAISLAQKNLGFRILILEAGPLTLLEHIGSSAVRLNARAVHGIQNQITYQTSWVTEEEFHKGRVKPNTKGWAAVGGRTLLWGGYVPRFLPSDFDEWPFDYREFEKYYTQAETLICAAPRSDGTPPFVQSKSQEKLAAQLRHKGFITQESPLAIDTSIPINGNIPSGYDSSIARLLRSGHLIRFGSGPGISLVSDAEVISLEKKSDKIDTVAVLNKRTGKTHTLSPKHVVIAAGGLQSVRLVMSSKIEENKDVLGRYINDHLFARGFLKLKKGEWDGLMHLYAPPTKTQLFHCQLCGPLTEKKVEALAKDWTALPTKWLDWNEPGDCLEFHFFGIGTTEKNNRLVLDEKKDPGRDNLSRCTVIYDRSERDHRILKEMHSFIEQAADAMDAKIINWEILSPGTALHDIGGLRMGADPSTSIVNPSGQFWRIRNLSVADASAWPSQGSANPYLSITAWSLKHADELVKILK